MTYRHILMGDLVIREDREVQVVLTHCPARLWTKAFGSTRQWVLSMHREPKYLHMCVFGLELSIMDKEQESLDGT